MQRSVTFCRWFSWRRCLGGESRAGMLLSVAEEQEEFQGSWLPSSSPPAGVCEGAAVTRAWSLEDSAVEVTIPGMNKVAEILKYVFCSTHSSSLSKPGAYITHHATDTESSDTYPVCSWGRWSPGQEAAGWCGSAGVGRCRQCLEAGKLSVWTDYEPPALDSESTQSCRTGEWERRRGG